MRGDVASTTPLMDESLVFVVRLRLFLASLRIEEFYDYYFWRKKGY